MIFSRENHQIHNHPRTLNPERICCVNHLIEITTYFKQQGRVSEVQQLLVTYLYQLGRDDRIQESAAEGQEDPNILQVYGIDLETASELFRLSNEYASRLTVQGNFPQAKVLIEQALLLSKYVPLKLQSCLLSNISCYYERKNEMKSARLYYEHAIQLWKMSQGENSGNLSGAGAAGESPEINESNLSSQGVLLSDAISQAINFNNLSVIELRQKNYAEASVAAKNALGCIEAKLMEIMNKQVAAQLKNDSAFVENLMVLLVAYFNFGMCLLKTGMKSSANSTTAQVLKSLDEANQSFQHALKMSSRYLGTHHYFSQKLVRKVQICENLLKQAKALSHHGKVQNLSTKSTTSPGQNMFGFVPQKKSILRQHQEFLLQSEATLKPVEKVQPLLQSDRETEVRSQHVPVVNKSIDEPRNLSAASMIQHPNSDSNEPLRPLSLVDEPIQKVCTTKAPLTPSKEKDQPIPTSIPSNASSATPQPEKPVVSQEQLEIAARQERLDKELERQKELSAQFAQREQDLRQKQIQLEHQAEVARLEEKQRLDQLEIEFLKKQQEETTKLAAQRRKMEDEAAQAKQSMEKQLQKFQEMVEEQKKFAQETSKKTEQPAYVSIENQSEQQVSMNMKPPTVGPTRLEQSAPKRESGPQMNLFLKTPNSQGNDASLDEDVRIKIMSESHSPAFMSEHPSKKTPGSVQVLTDGPSSLNTLPEQTPQQLKTTKTNSAAVHPQLLRNNTNIDATETKLGQKSLPKPFKPQSESKIIDIDDQSSPNPTREGDRANMISSIGLSPTDTPTVEEMQISPNEPNKNCFSQQEIEQILQEDHEQYDISLILKSKLLELDLKKEPDCRKIVSKIIPAEGKYVKTYCEGYLNSDGDLSIKLTGVGEDSQMKIVEEDLDNSMLYGICKVMIVHGVMPLNQPLKLIKSFTDFARICIFPFLTCIREDSNNSDAASLLDYPEEEAVKEPSSNTWNIELLGLPNGVLEEEISVRFMNNECCVVMHHLQDESFRMTITSLEDEHIRTVSIKLELEFEQEMFDQLFEYYEHESFTSSGRVVGLRTGETMIRSLRVVSKDFIEKIKFGLHALERHLLEDFGDDVSFNFLAYEKSGLIYQLRFFLDEDPQDDQGNIKIELWTVKDFRKEQNILIKCKTLYTLRLRKHQDEEVVRTTELPYQNIWTYFGLNKKDLTRTQLHLVAYLYLKTLFLHLPTMQLNKGDDEDSDFEEKALIHTKPIDTIAYLRRIIEVKNQKVPATIQLLGCDSKFYLGIKVTLFDPATVSESGFFLTVKQKSWERSDSEKSMIRKKNRVKQEILLDFYKLPAFIQSEGGDQIFKKLEVMSRAQFRSMTPVGHEIACDDGIDSQLDKKSTLGDTSLYWPSSYGLTSLDFFARDQSLRI